MILSPIHSFQIAVNDEQAVRALWKLLCHTDTIHLITHVEFNILITSFGFEQISRCGARITVVLSMQVELHISANCLNFMFIWMDRYQSYSQYCH